MSAHSSKNALFIQSFAFLLGLFISGQSVANDLISSAVEQANSDISSSAEPIQSTSENNSDTLSETASIALETIDQEDDATTEKAALNEPAKPIAAPIKLGASKNPYAQLVSLAFKGKGLNGVNSYTEAAAQFCKAVRDTNDANAEFALGWLYTNGRGVEKDENVAAMLFTKAANQGHESAKNWLANSKGNAMQAAQLKCLLPDPPVAKIQNLQSNPPEVADSTPFYTKGPIYRLVSKIAPRFNIDTDLAMAFIAVESGFNPKATSPKNARGLMQLIPETAARFKVKDSYDPEDNIKGGLAYLQWLLTHFEGDVKLVAAAYNSGENTVERYNGVPPYPETKKYVRKIASLYKKPFHPYNESENLSRKFASAKVSG